MRLVSVLAAVVLVTACGSGSPPKAAPDVQLVWTTWTPDPKATSGPEPGYRPALTGLTGHDVQSAAPIIDPTGTVWELDLLFTPRGASLFSRLTQANVAACAGDPRVSANANCAQRHLATWANLTQADIDNWDDATFVAAASMPFDIDCLMRSTAGVCPKFISDPITIDQITGGRAIIAGAFTERSANALATAINSSR